LYLTDEKRPRMLRIRPDRTILYDAELAEPARTRPFGDLQGRCYVGGETALTCLEPDGSVAWTAPYRSNFGMFGVRADQSVLLAHVSELLTDPVEFTLHDRKGKVLWEHRCADRPGGFPASGPDGQVVLTEGNRLVILDSRGQPVGTAKLDGKAGEPLVTPEGTVLVGTDRGTLYALTLEGTERWRTSLGDPLHRELHLRPDGSVLTRTLAGDLKVVGPDGSKLWGRHLDNPEFSVVPGRDGSVAALVNHSRLELIDADGNAAGSFARPILSVAAVPGGFAACDYGTVYLLGPGTPPAPGLPEKPEPAGSVKRVGDWLIVGGVRTPIRRPRF
ncbi:MAG: PQQ-binding-like beta-propeller repeat protein, partial [Candidatus Eremiobacterota bacterium]